MKHLLSTIVRTIDRQRIDGELAVPIWNLIQIEVKEFNRAKVTTRFWNSVGLCMRVIISDNVSRSVRKKIKNENTSTSS